MITMFYIFAFFSVLSALATVFLVNPIYSVLSLIFLFLNMSGLFILLNAEFLAIVLIILYVGALAVVFLFVIMLINLNEIKKNKVFNKFTLLAAIITAIFTIEVVFLILNLKDITAKSITSVNLSSLEEFGVILYNDYFYLFLVLGLMLFIALIGVVMVINSKDKSSTYTQDMAEQRNVKPFTTVKLVKVNNKEGVK